MRAPVLGRIASIALLAGFGLALAGCARKATQPSGTLVTVQAATVQRKTIHEVVSSDALLYPRRQASIVPKISAPIRRFYVNRGSPVHKGELLAVLENKDLAAAVEQAKGAYEQAEATYATSTQVNLPAQIQSARLNVKATAQAMKVDRLIYRSRLRLFKSGAMSRNLMDQSHVTYIQAYNKYQIAEAHLKALEAVGQKEMVKSAQGQLASAKGRYLAALAQLHYSEIRSPITGVVTNRPLYQGQMATAGTPLMTVMNLSQVIGRAYVSPQQAEMLRVGDSAMIDPGAGQPEVPAKVTVVSPALDPNSTTVQVWVEAPNPGGRLKPGATVRVHMTASTQNALVVPAEAVLTANDGATSVMVIGPHHHAHQTPVKIGITEKGLVQILSGLHEGEQVVTNGAYGLPDGTQVRIASSGPADGSAH